jgi:hypothetical protein
VNSLVLVVEVKIVPYQLLQPMMQQQLKRLLIQLQSKHLLMLPMLSLMVLSLMIVQL